MPEYSEFFFQAGLWVIGLSIVLRLFWSRAWTVWVLLLGAGLLAFSAGLRDDFLHRWDERYHALVAANAVDDPLAPKLFREKLLPIDHDPWYRAHIWLHKQPLFTWQMAGAMALFGKNLITMRLSSVLMMILLTWSVYRSSRLFFPQGAFWVTAMMSGQAWLLLLVSGRQGMDHNDMAFIAWIGVSFWGWAAQQKSPHWKWLVLTGVAAGLAMLTKWLAGSLVLCMWLLQLVLSREKHGIQWRKWLGALFLALLIFLPWQVYSYWQWPEVFMREWEHNRLHISIALEGHDYPWYYHLKIWWKYFSPFCIAFGLALVALRHKLKESAFLQSLILGTFAAMAFYSLAQTKLPSYTLILLPGFAFLSAAAWQVLSRRILRITLGVLL